MAKPVLMTVDDDADVLKAVERDLRSQYAKEYRVMGVNSGAEALNALRGLRKRNDHVALLLVDQRMPEMTGVQFLGQAMEFYPNAKRVLLTAYADTDAAIQAINEAKIQHYLLKPWDPPDRNLYPVLDDLLQEWQGTHRPGFEGIRVFGHRWSPACFSIREFLARNQVPYQWLDLELAKTDPKMAREAKVLGADAAHLPVVIFPDGTTLCEPNATQLAEKIGLRIRADSPFYDLVIVGGGPAGLAAAVYGASEGLKTVMIEREAPGGQAGMSSRIENYLGFPAGLSGADLARRGVAQARRFGVEILTPQAATAVRVEGPSRVVKLSDGSEVGCKVLLLATGVSYRKLDVPGAEHLQGRGVYYGAAMTEVLSGPEEDVYIVGGANSAGQAAMHFSKYARRVVMLVRGDSLSSSMSQYLIDQIKETKNIQVEPHTQVVEVHGEARLEAISIKCSDSGTIEKVPAGSLFVFIGAAPRTDWLSGVVERDEHGFILTGSDLTRGGKLPKGWTLEREPFLPETNVPGIFAVGDVRHGSVKRVASGVGEGSIAVQFIHQYLSTV